MIRYWYGINERAGYEFSEDYQRVLDMEERFNENVFIKGAPYFHSLHSNIHKLKKGVAKRFDPEFKEGGGDLRETIFHPEFKEISEDFYNKLINEKPSEKHLNAGIISWHRPTKTTTSTPEVELAIKWGFEVDEIELIEWKN